MLKIRLQRVGRKNQPHFRVVVVEHAKKVKGKYHEALGHYNPRSKETVLNADRIKYWLSCGVPASPTVHNLLVTKGIISAKKVQAWKPKKSAKGDAAAGAA
ncbi:MAG: 30S ribosomal protein S16 [bacterium]|nr:30S ribosomal protein S16 [bacterium]